MRKKTLIAAISLLFCVVLMFCSAFATAAIDDKYSIDELGMSIKIPKEYTVITRETKSDDEAFKTLSLDYDETITAFTAANIYLQAVSADEVLKITLTQTSDKNSQAINNYSDLSASERKTILDAFLSDKMYTSGVEVKHNSSIYFDLRFSQKTRDDVIYGYQCHTVVNGMNINLTMQKNSEDLTADEVKVITNIANSINFNKIKRSSGLAFDWWRVLLWLLVLVAIAILANYFYRLYNKTKRDNADERRARRKTQNANREFMSEEDKLIMSGGGSSSGSQRAKSLFDDLGVDDEPYNFDDVMSFEETLGYDINDYHSRANTDLDTFDIDVKEKDPSLGVSLFEDSGHNINDKEDYFEDYFKEEVEARPVTKRAASSIALNVKLFFKHLAYFFKNLINSITKKVKSKGKKK